LQVDDRLNDHGCSGAAYPSQLVVGRECLQCEIVQDRCGENSAIRSSVCEELCWNHRAAARPDLASKNWTQYVIVT
jgi:hypothetical protein